MGKHRSVILCILDGWGIGKPDKSNAILNANLKIYNFLLENYPHSKLLASEGSVGLPSYQMGNSEVGHMTIGGGRVFNQDLLRIGESLKSDIDNISSLKKNISTQGKHCHIVGLFSDGGVHSHIDHVLYLAEYYVTKDVPVLFHLITDGRDTLPKSAKKYVKQVEEFCKKYPLAKIATISGRYYAMDRDKRYDRTEKAYNAIVSGKAKQIEKDDILDFIDNNYEQGVFDEFIEPSVIKGYDGISEGDLIVFANFRADRMRQIVDAVAMPNFSSFNRARCVFKNIKVLTMTEYSDSFRGFVEIIFLPEKHHNLLTDILDKNHLSQLRVAETEKYAHITFFFDAGQENVKKLEKRILIPSPKVETYDLKPEMSAYEITDTILSEFEKKTYDFCLVNYANADMVGHTGNYEASVKAVKSIDICLGKLYDLSKKIDATLLITADHGNVEMMFDDKNKSKHTAHTTNPVPFIFVDHHKKPVKVRDGALSDIAPTVLDLFSLKKPEEMTGESLVIR